MLATVVLGKKCPKCPDCLGNVEIEKEQETRPQVWSGNEDDCREVTWEECNPVEKIVPMSVAKMICVDMPVGEIFRGLISYTSRISFPHFMVLTDSIMMFHPDFQGDLLRLCKRNKPSHGRYYGLYCRKGLKTNS